MANPPNRPSIPPYIRSEDVVAIIGFTTPNPYMHLDDTTIRRTRTVRLHGIAIGVDVFLLRGQDTFEYGFGRPSAGRNLIPPDVLGRKPPEPKSSDVTLHGLNPGQQQFKLVPDWESNTWRVHSMSEKVFTVNGVPLQKPTARTRRAPNAHPHVLYLDPSSSNRVVVGDVQMDIWLMKSPREIVTSQHQQADRIDLTLQDVSSRNEEWAGPQYILTGNQVSNRSHAVLQRFTGRSMVAKMFDDPNRRNVEFEMFNKPQVDASIVVYRQSTDIGGTPAIITDSYEGFRSYASLRESLRQKHPGLRFEAATRLIHRLFAAMESLHNQGIVHGDVTHNSVLIRVVNDRIEQVLLVDYSSAYTFSPGDIIPREAMSADGKAIIQLADDLCDIWTLRMAPTATAQNEAVLRKRNEDAAEKYETVERCFHDYIDIQEQSEESEMAQRLIELLLSSKAEWDRAQADLIFNGKLKEIGSISRPTLDEMRNEHVETHGPLALGTGIHWNLSLGHPYMDGLVTRLYHEQWDITPREICGKIREIAGTVEEPWQIFHVTLTFTFEEHAEPTNAPAGQNLVALTIQPILSWLAVSCEIYPEWRLTLQTEADNTISSTERGVNHDELHELRRALNEYGTLPSSLHEVFEYLLSLYDKPSQETYAIDISYKVWYHQPSSMFNATQLQHLASPESLRACIAERRVTCDNFVEVRGSPELEGCYAPMALLPLFIAGLGLTVRNPPDTSIRQPTFNPSDFSQVPPQGRVVLVRLGLLGYATIVRSLDQCGWPQSVTTFETPAAFLPTYYGDVKVFSDLPHGSRHPRPDHWAQYVTSSSVAAGTSTQQQIDRASPQYGLSDLLRQRETVRAAAFRRRSADEIDPEEPATRRALFRTTPPPNITNPAQGGETQRSKDPSIPRRNSRPSGSSSTWRYSKPSGSRASSFLQQRAPSIRHNLAGSTTVVDVAPVGYGDWEKVERWLAEEANSSQDLSGIRGISNLAGSETEVDPDSPPSRFARRRRPSNGSETEVDPDSPPSRFARRPLFKKSKSSPDLVDGSETTPQQIDPAVPRRDSSLHRATSRRQLKRVSFYSNPASAMRSQTDRGQQGGGESIPDTDPGFLGSQDMGDLPDADGTPS